VRGCWAAATLFLPFLRFSQCLLDYTMGRLFPPCISPSSERMISAVAPTGTRLVTSITLAATGQCKPCHHIGPYSTWEPHSLRTTPGSSTLVAHVTALAWPDAWLPARLMRLRSGSDNRACSKMVASTRVQVSYNKSLDCSPRPDYVMSLLFAHAIISA
jgi:hypothetical protein